MTSRMLYTVRLLFPFPVFRTGLRRESRLWLVALLAVLLPLQAIAQPGLRLEIETRARSP